MIVYLKCLCRAQDKLLAQRLREMGYEVRVINKNPQWRREAALYRIKPPFRVVNGIAEVI